MYLTNEQIHEIETKIDYSFKNKNLLEQAFMRSSFCNENPFTKDNEVLEFIGDSVLGMLVVKHLSERYRIAQVDPQFNEEVLEELSRRDDPLSKRIVDSIRNRPMVYSNVCSDAELSEMKIDLVKRSSLAWATEQAGLEQYLLLGKSDESNNVRQEASVKEDLLEAILGAATLDADWDITVPERIVRKLIQIDERLEKGLPDQIDYEEKLNLEFPSACPKVDNEYSSAPYLPYGCEVTVGSKYLNERFEGFGATEEGARRMAFKRAYERCSRIGDLATRVQNTVGLPDKDRAVNQLQELFQKKIIREPQYIFTQESNAATGNPQWGCRCVIPEAWEMSGSYVAESKTTAKKQAAFETLNALLGYDLSVLFREHGTPIEE